MEFNDFSDQLTELHNISIELSKTESFDILCLKAIEMGQKKLGFERLSFWYVDSENTNYLKGSFGTDEVGHIRDERDVRLLIDQSDVNAKLLSGITHIIYMEDHDLFNNKGEVVGRGEIAIVGLWDGNKYIGSISCDNLLTGTPISKHQRKSYSFQYVWF